MVQSGGVTDLPNTVSWASAGEADDRKCRCKFVYLWFVLVSYFVM